MSKKSNSEVKEQIEREEKYYAEKCPRDWGKETIKSILGDHKERATKNVPDQHKDQAYLKDLVDTNRYDRQKDHEEWRAHINSSYVDLLNNIVVISEKK